MTIRRGDIYFVTLDPTRGREQSGNRPVLMLSIDAINRQPLVATVVVGTKGTSQRIDYPSNVRVAPADSGLSMETVFLCFQIRSLDNSRFPDQPSGTLSPLALARVEGAVRYCLGL